MEKKITEKYFPIRHDAEDEIFIICMSEIEEFPAYITQQDDIIGKYDSRCISDSYRNLNMDSVIERKDKSLINIEHHSSINSNLMRRDYEYCVTLHAATKRPVGPYILYTGKLPIKEIEHANELMFFNPTWVKTRKWNGNKRLNNLKYKIEKQEICTVFDIIELIWLPRSHINLTIVDTILTCIKLYNEMIADEWLKYVAKKCLKLWVGRYIKDKNQIKEAARGLKMSALELRPFEQQLENVLYANRLEQAEERGEKLGIKKGEKLGEESIIKKLLKKYDVTKVAEMTEIDIEKIEKIRKSKYSHN